MSDDTPKLGEVVNESTDKTVRYDSVAGVGRKVEIERESLSDNEEASFRANSLIAEAGEVILKRERDKGMGKDTVPMGFAAVFYMAKPGVDKSDFVHCTVVNIGNAAPALETIYGMGLQELAIKMAKRFGRKTMLSDRYVKETMGKTKIESL